MILKEHGIEQLWYTWSTTGIGGAGRGFQIRAASPNLIASQRSLFGIIANFASYQLPDDINPTDFLDTMNAPVSLTLINSSPHGKILAHKVYCGSDGFGRPGNFFTHMLVGLPEDFSAREAIRLWKSPIWQTHDVSEGIQPVQLPPLSRESLEAAEQAFDFYTIEDALRRVIQAYLAPNRLRQRVLITGTSEQVAALIWGLTHSIPATLLTPEFTFTTYERPARTGSETIHGLFNGYKLPAEDWPSPNFLDEPQKYPEKGTESAIAAYASYALNCLQETMRTGSTNGRSPKLDRRIEQAIALQTSTVEDFVRDFIPIQAVPPPVAVIPPAAEPPPETARPGLAVVPPAAPSTAALIPYLTSRISIIVFGFLLFSGIGVVLSKIIGSTLLLFLSQMTLVATLICFTPTLTYWITKRRDWMMHVLLESFLFVSLFLLFSLWLFGISSVGIWIFYAAALIIFIEAGSYAIDWQKDAVLKRLAKGVSFRNLQTDASAIEMTFRQERILYFSVPLGLLVGTIIGFVQRQILNLIILTCLQYVLILSSLVLLYFLAIGFRRMCNPLYATSHVPSPELIVKNREGTAWLLEIVAPPTSQALSQKGLDLAHDVSDLRSIYKYDALHNTLLIVLFTNTVLNMHGIKLSFIWLILAILASAFLCGDLPYAIGQHLLHEKVLEQYTGTEHSEKKKLEEYAPLFPPLALLAGLTTAATIGGFLVFLLNLFLQGGLLGK